MTRGRAGRRHLHRDLFHQRGELVAVCNSRRRTRELHLDADLAADVNVLADVAVVRIADEAWHGHVLAELANAGGHALLNRTVRILQPEVGCRVTGLLNGCEDIDN